jgi:hypothetical protein
MLSNKRIEELASAPGVRKEHVLRFLGSLKNGYVEAPAFSPGRPPAARVLTQREARSAYDNEKVFFKYNAATQRALLLGMREHFENKPAEHKSVAAARSRILLVSDGTSWYVRRVRAATHDSIRDERVYRCDREFGGPMTLAAAVKLVKDIELGRVTPR